MKWLVVFISLLALSCATLSVQEPLNITHTDVENSEILYTYTMTPYHVLAFSRCHGVPVAFIVFVSDSTIVRYCYLDRGKLVGFAIDAELFKSTHEKVYLVDNIPAQAVIEMTQALNRMDKGLPPIDTEDG